MGPNRLTPGGRAIAALPLAALLLAAPAPRAAAEGEFTDPHPVRVLGYSGDVMEPFISRDGRCLLFNDSNAPGRDTNLHYAERIDDLTFDYRGPLAGANSPALDAVASLDRDGRLVFVSTRSHPITLSTLYQGRFADGAVTGVRLVDGVSRQLPGWVNFDAELSADGETLYFVDGRFGPHPLPKEADLVIAEKRGEAFERRADSGTLLARVNTTDLEYAPAVSADGLELFFTRHDGASTRIFRAARSSADEPFGAPAPVAAAGGFVEAPALSPDGRSLYYHRRVGGKFVLYRLTRQAAPPPGAAWEPERRLTRQGAVSQTTLNFARSVAADARGRVHLMWTDERDGNREIYVKRSIDGGVSWGPPRRLSHGPGTSDNPSLAVVDDLVHVVFWDERQGGRQIYYARSRDGGMSWEEERPLTASPGGPAYPSVAADGDAVHVVYVDAREGSAEVYYLRSSDGGTTWNEPERLSSRPWSSHTPTVATADGAVYAAWTDTRDQMLDGSLEEEYFRRSLDSGASWEAEQRLTHDPANSWAPSLAADASDVWIVWFDERGGGWEIYTKRSTDRGATWTADRRLTQSPGSALRPVLAYHDDALQVVYWDDREGVEEVYGLSSTDRGDTWSPAERRSADDGHGSLLPSVAAAGSGMHVVWTDGRDGNPEIYYRRLPGAPVGVANGRVAFTRKVGGTPQIFTVDAGGGDLRQLTSLGANQHPAWSKDGSTLAFSTDRDGAWKLWLMDADGSHTRPLTAGLPGQDFVPDFSHDGTLIAYASLRDEVGHPEIWLIGADGGGGRLTELPPGGVGGSVHPSWAPGDRALYYGSGASGSTQVWGVLPDGRGAEQKTAGLGPGYPEANVPDLARQGERLVFWAGIEGNYGEVWTLDLADPSGPRQLTETPDPRNSDNPSWSPDGARILFDTNRSERGVEIWVMNADGSAPRPFIAGEGQTSWQPVTAGADGGGGNPCGEPFACVPSATELCLQGSRYRVTVEWRDFLGHTGVGGVAPFGTDDSGLFWFFDEDNWELLVKVLDGCPLNGHRWVLAAATTNVAYTLTVADADTGCSVEYENQLGVAAPAITDTAAFADCP